MAYLPCQNPNCKSEGRPHPNCHCYDHIHGNEKNRIMREDPSVQFPGSTRKTKKRFAKGGAVEAADHYCDSGMAHRPSCAYFKAGGMAQEATSPQDTHDHSAAFHGLSGMLSNVGNAKINNPDQHVDAVANIQQEYPEPGHPLVGSIGKENMFSALQHLGKKTAGKEPHPEAFRGAVDYLHSSVRGKDKLTSKINSLFDKTKPSKIDPSARIGLDEKVKEYTANPAKMLEVGGNLGHYMPEQTAQLAESAATAVQYLNGLKPQGNQGGPLDPIAPPSKFDQIKYDRALDIANDPTLIIDYAKRGQLESQDLQTLTAIYPKIAETITKKATEFLIEKGGDLSKLTRPQKRSLSALMGQPMTFTQGPDAIKAIMAANAGAETTTQGDNGPKKASGVELKQINKVNQNSATDLQFRQLSRKS